MIEEIGWVGVVPLERDREIIHSLTNKRILFRQISRKFQEVKGRAILPESSAWRLDENSS